ncbi:MAG TPA: hypothetical protein VFA99_16225 [Acidobacteriaceae bacterium]|nr:hypothetical protein [Acidobacteriaceae bacterium]
MRFGIVAVAGLMVAAGAAQAQQVKAAEPQLPTAQQTKAIVARAVQTAVPGAVPAKGLVIVSGPTCPAGLLRADQQATGGATLWTTAQEDEGDKEALLRRPTGLGVHVDFQGTTSPVKALELRVSYEPLGLKRVPAGPGTNGFVNNSREREKNFNVDREAAMRIRADLLVGPAATITRVHLMSATFADGSVWRAPTPDACSVVPNRFMRVKSK